MRSPETRNKLRFLQSRQKGSRIHLAVAAFTGVVGDA